MPNFRNNGGSSLAKNDLKTTEEIKRDVQAQLQLLKAGGGSPKGMQIQEFRQEDITEDLRTSMGDQNLRDILLTE